MSIGRSSLVGVAGVLSAIILTMSVLSAQSSQTLPRGLDAGPGAVVLAPSTFDPFGSVSSHIWQFHYDSGQFNATGRILISQISIGVGTGAPAAPFSFPSVEILMSSSPTDYCCASGGTLAHSPVFSFNLGPDATVVRPASAWSGTTAQAPWIPLGQVLPFDYDPTLGRDLVVQVRSCGGGTPMNQGHFRLATPQSGIAGYGDWTSCTATSQMFGNEFLGAVVKIDYADVNRLAVSQSGPGVGDVLVNLSSIPASAYEGITLMSGLTLLPAGLGPFLGILPDLTTWTILGFPYAPGNPFHFRPGDSGVFPSVPFAAPPGSVSALAGQTFDVVTLLLKSNGVYDSRSNVVRILFQ